MKNYIIIALSAIVLGLSGYMLYDSFDSGMSKAEVQSQFNDLKSDYEFMQKDLENSVSSLNASNKVVLEQKNRLEAIMRKNSITEEELLEAKKIMRSISQSVYNNFENKIADLEKEKLSIENQTKKSEEELKKLNEKYLALENTNKDISKKFVVEKKQSEKKDVLLQYASNLTLSNFILRSFKVRSNGKEVETDKASRIERIKVSFDILENMVANSGKKDLYIVVHKPDGSVATFKGKPTGTFVADAKTLTYSDKTTIDYVTGQPKTLEFVWDNEDFSRGDYVMEVYEQRNKGAVRIARAIKTLE